MDEVIENRIEVRETKIEVDLHKEKVDFMNYAYEKGLQYCKRGIVCSVGTFAKAHKHRFEPWFHYRIKFLRLFQLAGIFA